MKDAIAIIIGALIISAPVSAVQGQIFESFKWGWNHEERAAYSLGIDVGWLEAYSAYCAGLRGPKNLTWEYEKEKKRYEEGFSLGWSRGKKACELDRKHGRFKD